MRAAPLVAIALVAAGCQRDPIGMVVQQKKRPYEPSTVFEDGRSMRTPPPGTVAIERPAGSDEFLTGRSGGEPVDRIPVPLSRELLARGRHDFEIWCAACHGVLGDGDSQVARNMELRPPPSLVDRRFAPGHVFEVIGDGYGLMPSYAAEIPVTARWAVAGWVEVLRRSQRAPIATAPPDVRRALEEAPR